jgi:hypothetical protein
MISLPFFVGFACAAVIPAIRDKNKEPIRKWAIYRFILGFSFQLIELFIKNV